MIALRIKYSCYFAFALIAAALSAFHFATALPSDSCTDACDSAYPGGLPVQMCGIDITTHSTHSDVFAVANPCYAKCNIMMYYPGTCGCPNYCFNEFGQGTCARDNTCDCEEGWGGEDCSLPVYLNKCSLHGKLVTSTDKDSAFPFDYCQCDVGFTGSDCSSPIPKIGGNAPWGTVFDDVKVWYNDDYEDEHPVWNISVFATIRVEVETNDYLNLLLPQNLYNETYAPAAVYFDNGNYRESFTNVGMKVQGQGSRLDQKKGWGLKFNEFVKGQKLFGVEKLKMKACTEDNAFLKIQFTSELIRAVGLPIYRSSFALLYINGIYSGLYFIHEDFDTTFLESRYPGDGSGNLMQLYYNVHLAYFGSDDTYYRERVHMNALGVPENYFTQSEGNDDWTDLIDFLNFVNSTTDADFESNIDTVLDTRAFLRSLVVESFILSDDNIASGNNMYVYHLPSNPKAMTIFTYDHESVFLFDSDNEPENNPDIFDYYITTPGEQSYENTNPLLNRLMVIPKYNSTYLDYYSTFLEAIFGSSSKQQPSERVAALFQLILPWLARDRASQVSNGITANDFTASTQQFIEKLNWRYQNSSAQVNEYR